MHSLNAGFIGLKVPIKDQMYFKPPDERKRNHVRGKWTNYPMSIEIRKIAGYGTSGSYLAECVLGGINVPNAVEDNFQAIESRVGSSLMGVAPAYRDKEEERFYQAMYDEIRQVVANQEDAMLTSRHKLKRILLNDSENSIRPDIVSPAHEQRRVNTSYGFANKPHAHLPAALIKRPHTTVPTKDVKRGSLLLPVPVVPKRAWGERQSPDTALDRLGSVSPWLPRISTSSPFYLKGRQTLEKETRWNSPEPLPPSLNVSGNFGVSAADRVNRLLNAAVEEESIPTTDQNYLNNESEKSPGVTPRVPFTDSSLTAPHSSLSVVVPASYQEPPSLPQTPLPLTPNPLPPAPESSPAPGIHEMMSEKKSIKSPREKKMQKFAKITPKVTTMQFTPQEDRINDLGLEIKIQKYSLLCDKT
ncbi:uncharacterized protein LOC143462166 isoform X3 [Clavelina lepadiformis]